MICGGGVIGACTAYFLARRGADVVVASRLPQCLAKSLRPVRAPSALDRRKPRNLRAGDLG
nr:FAD-dependent oxidoreductase [Bradyrhizobium sp. sBnM-33]